MTTPGHTTKLEYGDAATGSSTWVELSAIIDITPPAINVDDVETSHMQSTEQFKTYIAGWKDPGEVSVTRQFDKAEQVTLYALVGVVREYRITLQDGSIIDFVGYIKGFGNPIDREGLATHELTLKVSGKPGFTAAA